MAARDQRGTSRPVQQQKCSKTADWTIKQNNLESELLKEHTKQLQKEYIFTRMLQRCEIMELRNELASIPKVQNNAPISAERKRFLRSHGIELDERLKEYNIQYFIRVIDELIGNESLENQVEIPNAARGYGSHALRLDFVDNPGRMIKDSSNNLTLHSESLYPPQEVHFDADIETQIHTPLMDDISDTPKQRPEQKEKKKKGLREDRPRHVFRTIEPPRRGRALWKQLESKDRVADEEDGEVLATTSKADVELNEEANSYRCKLLAAHKMHMDLTPCTSLHLKVLNR